MIIDRRKMADRIYSLMTAANLSVSDLSEMLGVSQMAVWKWVNAKTSPSLDNIAALCGIFNVSIDEIVVMKAVEKAA